MKARKINLRDYVVERMRPKKCPQCGESLNETDKYDEDYDIKKVIPNIMCHPSLKHAGYRFHTISQLAVRIDKCKDKEIIFMDTEYETIKKCFDDFVGYARNDAEMVARIYGAEIIDIEVGEKGGRSRKKK